MSHHPTSSTLTPDRAAPATSPLRQVALQLVGDDAGSGSEDASELAGWSGDGVLTSCVLRGLKRDTAYFCRARVLSAECAGAWSTPLMVHTGTGALATPPAPVGVAQKTGDLHILHAWPPFTSKDLDPGVYSHFCNQYTVTIYCYYTLLPYTVTIYCHYILLLYEGFGSQA